MGFLVAGWKTSPELPHTRCLSYIIVKRGHLVCVLYLHFYTSGVQGRRCFAGLFAGHPSIRFLWMWYRNNALKELLQIFLKCSLGSKHTLIKLWSSKVKCHCDHNSQIRTPITLIWASKVLAWVYPLHFFTLHYLQYLIFKSCSMTGKIWM